MAKISVNNLAHAIHESLKDKEGASFDDSVKNIISLMKEKHLLSKSPQILEALQNIVDEDKGIARVKVTTKEKIKGKEVEEIEEFIKRKYKAKEVVIETKEDEKLLGGMKIEIKDEVIDTTLANKLHQLQNYLITN